MLVAENYLTRSHTVRRRCIDELDELERAQRMLPRGDDLSYIPELAESMSPRGAHMSSSVGSLGLMSRRMQTANEFEVLTLHEVARRHEVWPPIHTDDN